MATTTVKVHSLSPSERKIDVEFQTTYSPALVQMGRDQAEEWGLLSPDAPEDAAGGIRIVLPGLHHDMCFGDQEQVFALLRSYVKDVWRILKNKVSNNLSQGSTVDPANIDGTTFDAES